jgi:hydroxyethylthiazole kinase-like uncharacterized protein yjeF
MPLQRLLPPPADTPTTPLHRRWPLYGATASRTIERRAAAALPAHTLMARAGTAVARLARAWQPHARRVTVLAGGGNNGGDGWFAAALLQRHLARVPGAQVRVVSLMSDPTRLPDDAGWARATALEAGVTAVHDLSDLDEGADLVIDAVFGLGLSRSITGVALDALRWLQACPAPTLCVDLPSGLDADSGRWWADAPPHACGPRVTLALLTLKPGLFTGVGRACVGSALWFDDLGVTATEAPDAWLAWDDIWPQVPTLRADHASHKGQRGDVLIIGGQLPTTGNGIGMTGAALLAGRAALRAGAGRVYVGLLGDADTVPAVDPGQPALMLRTARAALQSPLVEQAVVVAGCGGGCAMADALPPLLARAPRLVLDADALNALGVAAAADAAPDPVWARRRAAGWCTVLTPHPLEAARLLGTDSAAVQSDRVRAATTLAQRLGSVVVLKGSGTMIAAPGVTPIINASGDGLLATAGTGDVLAGLIGARLAQGATAHDGFDAVVQAVAAHGRLTQDWALRWPPTATDLID